MNKLNNKIFFLLLCQLLNKLIFAFSTQNDLPECEACLENQDNCFNDTLSNKLTIKSRGVEYIDLKLYDIDDSIKENGGRGTIVDISYIVVSTQGDSITVQVENVKDQYVLESRDNRVSCSYRKNLRLYKQNEKIAIHCNNIYYDCEVMFDVTFLKPQQEDSKSKIPDCNECVGDENSSCFESIYLPVHSWYYLYYDGYEGGTYLDFLVSSHKKDKMRIEVQNNDGLFYLVSTRRDKVRCSDPQISVPVRWKNPRIAVYCYNNYIGCKFSIFARSTAMNNNKVTDSISDSRKFDAKMMGYYESSNPKWSEWGQWSECIENVDTSRNGMGKRTRSRQCLQTMVDFVDSKNITNLNHKDIKEKLIEANIPYCEGPSIEYQNCPLETSDEHSWQNVFIFIFIISALILSLCREKRTSRTTIINTSYSNNNEDVIRSNNLTSSMYDAKRENSVSENSPLLNTYFRRYD
ncbi:hypothetical protein BCR36DRAFT_274557 [Piromyces finnis]|uniref:Autophagy-related protein 27 n=1 Tax=Piromyces finnis TaxID=1754191 RepID=A0A1Y1VN47_9FUNG|nr:hypothetical protein BCR36DRAFT_274557 [Piromyces finnis]|eukprot:ORX60042.1 hypothetical protein BCR36DRAFT_274557 [Piromyces finnis]